MEAFRQIKNRLQHMKQELDGIHVVPAEFVAECRNKNPAISDSEIVKTWVEKRIQDMKE